MIEQKQSSEPPRDRRIGSVSIGGGANRSPQPAVPVPNRVYSEPCLPRFYNASGCELSLQQVGELILECLVGIERPGELSGGSSEPSGTLNETVGEPVQRVEGQWGARRSVVPRLGALASIWISRPRLGAITVTGFPRGRGGEPAGPARAAGLGLRLQGKLRVGPARPAAPLPSTATPRAPSRRHAAGCAQGPRGRSTGASSRS